MLEKIESVTHDFTEALHHGEHHFSIELLIRGNSKHQRFDSESGAIRALAGTETRPVCFPGSSAKEAWKFGEQRRYSKMRQH
jgi:hypothetical protein